MTTIDRLSVVTPATWISGPKQGQWTYVDYVAIPENGHRYEVVRGVLYMTPSPNVGHQRIVGEIFDRLRTSVLRTGSGEVFIAPLDVELSYRNVVQPDVFVVLKEHLDRITSTHIVGAPDLVVEVASPGTARHDLREKQDAYASAGVPEYWVVNPEAHTVELLILDNDSYRSLGLFRGQDVLPSQVVPDMSVTVEQFFAKV